MTRAHFVKKARKAYRNDGIKKGESYYWWKFRHGAKQRSKIRPRQSQLTQSEFWSTVYSCREQIEDVPGCTDLESVRDDVVSQLELMRDEIEGRKDNMPEGLQEGSTGQMLEERMNALDECVSALQDVDCSGDEDGDEEEESLESEAKDSLLDAIDGISCE